MAQKLRTVNWCNYGSASGEGGVIAQGYPSVSTTRSNHTTF